jgi:hypothetical protein
VLQVVEDVVVGAVHHAQPDPRQRLRGPGQRLPVGDRVGAADEHQLRQVDGAAVGRVEQVAGYGLGQ